MAWQRWRERAIESTIRLCGISSVAIVALIFLVEFLTRSRPLHLTQT